MTPTVKTIEYTDLIKLLRMPFLLSIGTENASRLADEPRELHEAPSDSGDRVIDHDFRPVRAALRPELIMNWIDLI